MTKPVVHETADYQAWKQKLVTDRMPKAKAHGAEAVDEVEKLKVKHTIKDDAEFKKHFQEMKDAGKRKEMGAQNEPFE